MGLGQAHWHTDAAYMRAPAGNRTCVRPVYSGGPARRPAAQCLCWRVLGCGAPQGQLIARHAAAYDVGLLLPPARVYGDVGCDPAALSSRCMPAHMMWV